MNKKKDKENDVSLHIKETSKKVKDDLSSKTQTTTNELKELAKKNKEDLEAIQATKSKKSKVKLVFGIIFTIAMTALVFTLIINFSDFNEMASAVKEIGHSNNWVWLIVAGLCALSFFLLWPLTLMSFTKALGIKCKKRDMYAIGNCEHFYSYVTPSYTGGQPFQIYAMNALGIPTSKGTGAILATYTIHQLITIIYSYIALCFYPQFSAGVASQYNDYMAGIITAEQAPIKLFGSVLSPTTFAILVGVGYFFNTLTLVVTILLGTSKHIRSGLVSIALWISEWKWVGKFVRKNIPTFIRYLKNSQGAFKDILNHKDAFVKGFITRFIALGFFYSIPFFLMKAIGVNFANNPGILFIILFATSFAISSIIWLPTPGSSGGMEVAFAIVITSLSLMPGILTGHEGITNGQASVLSLMWRLYTYYLILFLSLFTSIYFQVRLQRNNRKEIKLLEMKVKDAEKQLSDVYAQEKIIQENTPSETIDEPSIDISSQDKS